jgi:hypothetical protein
MTNVDWFNTLNPELQAKIVHNVNSLNKSITFEWWSNRPIGESFTPISGAFYWDNSDEGHDYWVDISNEYLSNE